MNAVTARNCFQEMLLVRGEMQQQQLFNYVSLVSVPLGIRSLAVSLTLGSLSL